MTLAGKEVVVSNKAALEFYERCQVKEKEYRMEEDAIHGIIQDGEIYPRVVQETLRWQE